MTTTLSSIIAFAWVLFFSFAVASSSQYRCPSSTASLVPPRPTIISTFPSLRWGGPNDVAAIQNILFSGTPFDSKLSPLCFSVLESVSFDSCLDIIFSVVDFPDIMEEFAGASFNFLENAEVLFRVSEKIFGMTSMVNRTLVILSKLMNLEELF